MTMCFCYGCGVEKDPEVEEMYIGEDLCNDSPIPPLMALDCSGDKPEVWKTVVVCFSCFDRLQPDMWISENCWDRLNPFIPFEQLPTIVGREVDWNIALIEEKRQKELKNG